MGNDVNFMTSVRFSLPENRKLSVDKHGRRDLKFPAWKLNLETFDKLYKRELLVNSLV